MRSTVQDLVAARTGEATRPVDRQGRWVEQHEYSRANVSKAVRLVAPEIEQFLVRFLRGAEEARLDRFDLG
jgi:hypothetical protein